MVARMGRTADNESIKLYATFWNNSGVALYVAGAFLPVITAYGRAGDIALAMRGMYETGRPSVLILNTIALLIGCLVAMWIGLRFRARAQRIIQQLED
jgi:hypothetical protein